VVGSFTDANPFGVPQDFSATVVYALDSAHTATAQAAVVPVGGGTFDVVATLGTPFGNAGNFTVLAGVHDIGGAAVTITSVAVVADAPLIGSAQPQATAAEGAAPSNLLLGVFADTAPGPKNNPGDYAATILWDDGGSSHYSLGTLVPEGNNTFQIFGSDTVPIGAEGTRVETVVVNDGGGASLKLTVPLTVVAGTPHTATGTAIAAVEGGTFNGAVGTFVDVDESAAAAAGNTAQIAWGDGTMTMGQVTPLGGGQYAVSGRHAYAAAGDYQLGFTVFEAGSAANATTGTSSVHVADAGLSMLSVSGPAAVLSGQAINGFAVARFSDGDPFAGAGDFVAQINWGDGGVSGGAVVANGDGTFSVVGSHTYGSPGTRTVTVTVSDRAGSQASGSASVTASVAGFGAGGAVAGFGGFGGLGGFAPGQADQFFSLFQLFFDLILQDMQAFLGRAGTGSAGLL
jgi:hypothetical protein